MFADNPAARLLSVLEDGSKLEANTKCRAAWHQLLAVEKKGNEALLMSRLGKLMELPEQIIQVIKNDFPMQVSTVAHWSAQVNQMFSHQNLNGDWTVFRQHIDSHTISYLRLTADLIQTKLPTKLLGEQTIASLREKINQLLSEVLEGAFESEVKTYVARSLQKLLIALAEYRITGAASVLESVEAALGHAFFDHGYRDALGGTDLGKKVVDVLSAVSSAVTIALGVPQLGQSVSLMLGQFRGNAT